MQTVTTKAIAKVTAVAAGLAIATSMLSLAPYAHAAVASCTFTKDLTVGSKGADVTCLQNALIANGYSIPAGATGYFGNQTKAAVSAWQKAAGVSPTAGYFGPKSRAAFTGSPVTTTVPVTGNGLRVVLSPTSPNGTVLVQGQGIGDLGDFTFVNPTGSAVSVTGLTFHRIGVSNDSTLNNVYLYNGVMRLTDSAGVSNSSFSFTNPGGIFWVAPGGTFTASVRADILGGTSGQQIGASLVSVSSSGTLDSSVSFPINSGFQTVSAANLATVSFNATTIPAAATTISPQNDYPVWQNTVNVSTNPVKIWSMRFTNLGSIDGAYLVNLRLYVDGTQVGSAVPAMAGDRSITFDLSASPMTLSTQGHVIKVLANIAGGSNRTIQFSVQRSSDALFVDSQLNQPVTPVLAPSTTTFGAVTSGGAITIAFVSGTSGVSVSKDPASPTQNVAVGASNVKWGSFDLLASGEQVKVNDLNVFADTVAGTGGETHGGLANGKVFVNGIQVGSTKAIGEGTGAATDFALGSSLILPAGINTMVDIYGDAKVGSGVSINANLSTTATVKVSLKASTSNAQGQSSLNAVNVPSTTDVAAQLITVTNSSLTATKYSGYGAQAMIPGTTNAKIGALTLSTGSTEGVTVNTIVINLTAANAASLTNLWLKDDATGATLGTTITTPSTGNSFSLSSDIAMSSTKTIDVYANILSGANAGPVIATVDYTTSGVGDTTGTSAAVGPTAGSNVALQTITVGTGKLSVTRGAGDPTSNNVVAGASSVKVAQFNFAAQNSAFTVQNLAVLIPNAVATSVTNVTVSYKDQNGATQTATQALAITATYPYATATFTGLQFYVPTNDSSNIDVFVGTPTVASGATSGAAINALISGGGTSGANNDFRSINAAGTPLTNVNGTGSGTSGPNLASNGTFYVFKSIPTFAMLAAPSTVPSSGSALYRFSITADPAGAVEWTHLKFNVATSDTVATADQLSNAYLVDEAAPSVNLLDNTTTSASTTINSITIDLTQNATQAKYQQIAAGSSKIYDLYATVAGYTTGSTISLSLASDSGFVTPTTAAGVGKNTVWSDRSAPGHTTGTSDWAGGFLLKDFTTNTTSYSK